MTIYFSNGKTFSYYRAIANDHDYKDSKDVPVSIVRPSLEIYMNIDQTSYAEISEMIHTPELMKSFTLENDPQPIYAVNDQQQMIFKNGEPVIEGYVSPQSVYENYTIPGKISVEDDEIVFKVYRKSATEVENEEAKQAIDDLLIAMEG